MLSWRYEHTTPEAEMDHMGQVTGPWEAGQAERRQPDERGQEQRRQPGEPDNWKQADARLRELASQAAALDWEVGAALQLARDTRAHERLGHASLAEYVERLFGYSPRMTAERLRVADTLRELPELSSALRDGKRSWSALRELTRVAVPATEQEWLDWSRGRTVRELEQAVSGLRPGDRPTDPPDPHLQRRVLRLEVGPEAFALFRDAVAHLRRELDPALTEEQALQELCRRTLSAPSQPTSAPYQVALTICDHCSRTWQDAGGEAVELPPETGARALCDAQLIPGDAQPANADTHVGAPKRATRTIAPATRRQVLRRDGGRCRVDGCSNHTWLHLHHLVPRSEGGENTPENLLSLCTHHHASLHAGELQVEGATQQTIRFTHADGTPYGEPPRLAQVEAHTDAWLALRALGFTETEARPALREARTHVGHAATTEQLVVAALRVLHRGRSAA